MEYYTYPKKLQCAAYGHFVLVFIFSLFFSVFFIINLLTVCSCSPLRETAKNNDLFLVVRTLRPYPHPRA